VGPDFVRPKAPTVDQYTAAGGRDPAATVVAAGEAQRFQQGAALIADWWRLFRAPALDRLIEAAIAHNPTLDAAQAALRKSETDLRAGYGVFLPQIDASYTPTRQRFSSARFGGNASSVFTLFTLATTVNYTLDVFGGMRRQLETTAALKEVTRAQALAAYLTLTGNVATAAIALAAYTDEVEATEGRIQALDEEARLTEVQVRAGTAPQATLSALQIQRATAAATLPPLRQLQSQTEHLLARLLGHLPGGWRAPPLRLKDLTLPADVPVTLPSQLARQRPDILAAEAALHAATASVGVATAALFPNFTLSATWGQNATSMGQLLNATHAFWSYGGGVVAPLFHGGSQWFQREGALASLAQALAKYRETLLAGFGQVADSLRALENDARAQEIAAQRLAAAAEQSHLVAANVEAGTANLLPLLAAQDQERQAEVVHLAARAQRLQDTAALFVALGGGWWSADGPQVERLAHGGGATVTAPAPKTVPAAPAAPASTFGAASALPSASASTPKPVTASPGAMAAHRPVTAPPLSAAASTSVPQPVNLPAR
jgi:NodT family efflux transporter outer membrane factor (OMF) lipoprotein